jgi:hypothetical protein
MEGKDMKPKKRVQTSREEMREAKTDDWLDELLMVQEPHIEADGFCEQVLEHLPRRRAGRKARAIVLVACLCVGGVVGLFVVGGGSVLSEALTRVVATETWSRPEANLHTILYSLVLLIGLTAGAAALISQES